MVSFHHLELAFDQGRLFCLDPYLEGLDFLEDFGLAFQDIHRHNDHLTRLNSCET